LAATPAEPNPHKSRAGAQALLETLQFHVDVDVGWRAGSEGRARLNKIEAAVFKPELRRMQKRIQGISSTRASPEWLPAMLEVERLIHGALVATKQWRRKDQTTNGCAGDFASR
jgi:hypothetical protein